MPICSACAKSSVMCLVCNSETCITDGVFRIKAACTLGGGAGFDEKGKDAGIGVMLKILQESGAF